MNRPYQQCTNCVMDTSDSMIVFDENGICDHCKNYYENIIPVWDTGERGKKKLNDLLSMIKEDAQKRGRKHEVLMGLSGGVDSSFLLYKAVKDWGLNPIVMTVDTGWNLPVAESNVRKVIDKLGVEEVHVEIDREAMANFQLSYFISQVPYQDLPQDHVIFASLFNYAAKNGYRYILTGGNYSTEGVREPNEWVHSNDLRQMKDIQKRFGTIDINRLPTCSIFKYKLYYRYVKGVQNVKVLDYIPYTKKLAIDTLKSEFDWEPYMNKHYESRFTRFYEGYWLIKKFGYDKRKCHLSSLILSGQLKRDDALSILSKPPYPEEQAQEDMRIICERMGISITDFIKMMNEENKTWKDYKSSQRLINLGVKASQALGLEKRNFR